MHRHALRHAAASLLLVSYTVTSTGCTSWKNQGTDAAAVVTPAPAQPTSHGNGDAPSPGYPGLGAQPVYPPTVDTVGKVRITTTSRSHIELLNPRIANDSLYGQEKKVGPESAFALSDVTALETHAVSAVKTGLLVFGALALTFAVAIGAYAASCADAVFGC